MTVGESTAALRLARYETWLSREPVDRPLLGLVWEPDIPPPREFTERFSENTSVAPEDIRPAEYLPFIEAWHAYVASVRMDFFQRFTPAFGIPWTEAIAGCPVKAAPGSLWAEPCLDDLSRRPEIRFDPSNPWFEKLIEFTDTLVEAAAGRFPVAAPQFRGPLDMLAALRTPAGMCMDLVDRPEETAELLAELAELWIAVGRAVLERIEPFQGGYVARMGSWTPGPVVTMQNDVSTLVSAVQYAKVLGPLDERIAASFPCTEFHMHASELHQVKNIAALERLTTFQLTLEHTLGGPCLEAELTAARRILQHKPLLLTCLDTVSADRCLGELPHDGLCVALATNERILPAEFVDWLSRHCV